MAPLIYLDNNATTALDPRVLQEMMLCFTEQYGNPSSAHQLGQKARQRVQAARRLLATALGVKPQEVLFTSSGTESCNTILQNIPKGHIITSSVEHSCVYHPLKELAASGTPVSFLKPGAFGAVTPEAVRAAIQPDTVLIALMAANNETGVKTDVEAIAKIAQETGIYLMIDAVALFGKEFFSLPKGVSALCLSAHKFHGPKGIGALIVRSSYPLRPLIKGGGQELNRRAGTENVAGIIGFAKAVQLLESELAEAAPRVRMLRDRLEAGLLALIPDAQVNGQGPRVGNTLNMSFPGVEGESLLIALDQVGIAVSHGSACSSGALEPSRILLEMGIPPETAGSAIRFSLSRMTTKEEIEEAILRIASQVKKLRGHA